MAAPSEVVIAESIPAKVPGKTGMSGNRRSTLDNERMWRLQSMMGKRSSSRKTSKTQKGESGGNSSAGARKSGRDTDGATLDWASLWGHTDAAGGGTLKTLPLRRSQRSQKQLRPASAVRDAAGGCLPALSRIFPWVAPKPPPARTALEQLAALMEQPYASVALLLERSAASDSHDLVRLRGYANREVHHFWAEGLAVHLEDEKVRLLEVFGDDHPFHRRAPSAQLYPGVRFGSSKTDVIAALGRPLEEFPESGWVCYDAPGRYRATIALHFAVRIAPYVPSPDEGSSSSSSHGNSSATRRRRSKKGGGSGSSPSPGGRQLIRVSGHADNFHRLSEGMLVKISKGVSEQRTYEALTGSPLEPFIARCFRTVDRGAHTLLYMEDLSAAYGQPCVMDVKMGTRTFAESEADNPKTRPDLRDKMLKMKEGKESLSAEELEKGITKLRYMQFREMQSTSASQGFRVEGIHLHDRKLLVPKELRTKPVLDSTLAEFVQKRKETATGVASRLSQLREALEASAWFGQHEIVSSSLLIVYDAASPPMAPPGVWMIDFAHVAKVDDALGHPLDHRRPWDKGNREEGYLFGLDNLIDTFKELSSSEDLQ